MKLKDLISEYGEYEVSDELIAQFKKPSPKTIWDLKDGDDYYCIYAQGYIDQLKAHLSDKSIATNGHIEMGNAFLTEEEAEQDRERRQVETLLLKHGGRRWFKNHKSNWFIALENEVENNPHTYNATSILKQGCIYFDTREEAENAIKEIGEDRIKQALFEVR